jgi:hypothetical protein
MSRLTIVMSAAMVCAMGLPGWAAAVDPPANVSHPQQGSNHAAASAQQNNVDDFGAPVSANTLKGYSGGAITTNNTQTYNGTVSNDSASQVITGDNAITGDAFSNASGLSSVIQNSGSNVLIQNGVIVNVEMKP